MSKFRYDINALRALAVTAVVLYHYKVTFVPGGYVGVDIFFVVSGYLMTDIIVNRLQSGNFRLFGFYYDRVKRIIPGLVGLCLVLVTAGFFLLDPLAYNNLGYTTISALLFFSNFFFQKAIGYFDPQTDTKWLLHTWSLSVEWQFYLIYPIFLMVIHKFSITRRYLTQILFVMATASVLLCIWSSETTPAAAFYMLPQRAWEMLSGGIVALRFKTCPQKYSRLLLTSGFLLIGVSVFCFDKNMLWPYYWALIPVIGTCLIIAANRTVSFLKNKSIQTLGKWSYSIYLWHWPIAVTFVYFNVTKTTVSLIFSELLILTTIILTGAVLLSGAQRFLNERRFNLTPAQASAVRIAGPLALTLVLALTVDAYRGFPSRRAGSSRQFETYKMVAADWDYPSNCDGMDRLGRLRPCQIGQSKSSRILVIGDSIAMQVFNRFVEPTTTSINSSFTFLASSGCPPVSGIQYVMDELHCNGFFDKALDFAEAGNFKRIVLVSTWYTYFSPTNGAICFKEGNACTKKDEPSWYFQHVDAALAALRARLAALKQRGVEIVLISTTPYCDLDVPSELLKRKFLGLDTKEIAYVDRDKLETAASSIKSRLKSLASSIGAKFVDPFEFLCDEHRCATIDDDGVPYFRDRGHYRSGAVRSARFRFLDDALGINNQHGAMPSP